MEYRGMWARISERDCTQATRYVDGAPGAKGESREGGCELVGVRTLAMAIAIAIVVL